MPNEIHRKVIVAETAFDFGTSFADIDGLPDGDLAWSAPVTNCEDCEYVDVTAKIKMGTSPAGDVRFYLGRNGATNRVGTDDIVTSDHGTEGTDADITRVLGSISGPIGLIGDADTTDKIHTVNFRIFDPGPSFNLFIYNDTGASLNNTSSPHTVHYRGWAPEVQ